MKMIRRLFLFGIITVISLFFSDRVEALSVVINEINFNPNIVADSDGEFIELYNTSLFAVPLDSYSFEGVSVDFTSVTLGPGEYLILASEPVDGSDTDIDSFESVYGDGDGDFDEFEFTILDFSGSLLNGGETLSLFDDSGLLVDSYDYSSFNTGTGADGGGFTIERIAPFALSINSNFDVSIILGGTPGYINSVATPVPEPSSIFLLVSGIIGLAGFRKKLSNLM